MTDWKTKAAADYEKMDPDKLVRMCELVSRCPSPCDLCAIETAEAPKLLLARMRNNIWTGLCLGCIDRMGVQMLDAVPGSN